MLCALFLLTACAAVPDNSCAFGAATEEGARACLVRNFGEAGAAQHAAFLAERRVRCGTCSDGWWIWDAGFCHVACPGDGAAKAR
jgi:hypothetical protein